MKKISFTSRFMCILSMIIMILGAFIPIINDSAIAETQVSGVNFSLSSVAPMAPSNYIFYDSFEFCFFTRYNFDFIAG